MRSNGSYLAEGTHLEWAFKGESETLGHDWPRVRACWANVTRRAYAT
jgi:hypothetical protein